jgi:nuclear pore complex protein Nup155
VIYFSGVFKPHIKYLLVLTTAVEILLLGVTFNGDEEEPNSCDLLLVPDPIFRVPTDNVIMNVIRGTLDGRIFLGGKDGSLYEIVYQAEDGWFGRKCKTVNHSSNPLSFLIPSFLNVSKEGLNYFKYKAIDN